MTANVTRCLTCGAPVAPPTAAWDDDGFPVAPAAFCSIHCEHYFGLQRASQSATAHPGHDE